MRSKQSIPSPSPVTPSPGASALPTEVWGGMHISLEVTDSGAEINYDCAHGRITEKIVPDRDGKFVVKGVHVRERPGPIRADEENTGQPAKYSGSIEGDTMTLTLTLSGTEDGGTYTLNRGKAGRIRKCL